METTRYHVILVQTMRHLIDAKSRMIELIRDILKVAVIEDRWDECTHYVTIVGFNNNSHRTYWNCCSLTDNIFLIDYLCSQLEFDPQNAYYRYGCALSTMDIFMHEIEKRMATEKVRASFHVITDGYDNGLNISSEQVCERIFILEEKEWDFSFYYVSRKDFSICKRNLILGVLYNRGRLAFGWNNKLRRFKEKAKAISAENGGE